MRIETDGRSRWLIPLAALALEACAAAAAPRDASLDANTVHRGLHCGVEAPAVGWIADEAVARALGKRLGGLEGAVELAPGPGGLVLVAMGTRPTAGYALAAPVARLREGVLELEVAWTEPPPGRIQAQVITSPCLVLRLPAVDFHTLRVVDRTGRVRLEAPR